MINNLIIKTSYSRLKDGSLKSNFGDLLRSTSLSSCLNNDFRWLTDSRALPLLKWFMDSHRLIVVDADIKDYGLSENTNIYNIDNYICDSDMFVQGSGAWHGYIRNGRGDIIPENDLIRCIEPYSGLDCAISWQEALIRGMGFEWHEQDYSASNAPAFEVMYDIGFNWHVHPEWESKKWNEKLWRNLEEALSPPLSVSWQQGVNDLDEYVHWISSCSLIVTCDTLGLHLASALRKKVVAIVGVTDCHEYSYGRVFFVRPERSDCMPCNMPVCRYGKTCLDSVPVESVARTVFEVLKK
ncbi:MAG: hypothetical protein M1147_12575 [Nitrospirae bacterium]|nr:hypothetical protein [Nitrospirota bacterium]MCL5978925.1 hypothetical protein [Nitrospirota bacterium]